MDSVSSSGSSSKFNIGGLVSGLNTDDVITQLLQVEAAPLKTMEAQKTSYQQQLTAWKSLDLRLTALQTSATPLTYDGFTNRKSATTSDESYLAVSVTSSAQEGSYDVFVKSLARAHMMQSQESFTNYDQTTVGTGTLTIKTGNDTVDVQITESNNTLEGIVSAINTSDAGVNASYVNIGTTTSPSYKRLLTSKNTGTADSITVTSSGITGLAFEDQQHAADAEIWIGDKADPDNNLKFVRSTNSISDAHVGITFDLQKIQASDSSYINIKVNRTNTGAQSSVSSFLSSINSLNDYFGQQFFYDADTGEQGVLQGDSTLITIQGKIDDLVYGYSSNSGIYHNLAQIGISADSATGKLSITDQDLFDEVLSQHAEDVEKLFNDDSYGIAKKMKTYIDGLTKADTGTVVGMEELAQGQIDSIENDMKDKSAYITRQEEYYRKQFNALETALNKLKSQYSSISSTIASMSSSLLSA